MKINQTCTNCIMDTSDPRIQFDEQGVCEYCNNFKDVIQPSWNTGEKGTTELSSLAEEIKAEGNGKKHDCIIGLSGGLDSSYVAYVAVKKMGLRPLLYHVDAGWNTDDAKHNVKAIADGLNMPLHIETINWEEMQDLQLAFLKSQVPDQDFPQDIAFFSALYKYARKNKIKYVITGANYSTECCREPEEWGAYPGIDKRLIMDIYQKFGNNKLNTFPMIDVFMYKIIYQRLLGMKIIKPLNLVPYIKADAEAELAELFGWRPFQHKHHESRFTRFYEDYWMPHKFGYHKRRAHFSSLIMTGQMTRDEALERISKPELSEEMLKQEFDYVAARLGITSLELQEIFEGENKTYKDYKNKRWLIGIGANVMRLLGLEKRLFR